MRTTEEIIEKIRKMMEEEQKKFEGCEALKKWFESMGYPEDAELNTNAKRHLRGYCQLAELYDYITINEK